MPSYSRQVFLNVPFDARYRKLLRALVFGVHECGLLARCAQEKNDGGQVRVEKLFRIIRDCRFGILRSVPHVARLGASSPSVQHAPLPPGVRRALYAQRLRRVRT